MDLTDIETHAHATFYVTGGTLPPDASSFVARQADKDLLASLLAGEYCYVLNSRQMGKSSLSVRTIGKLQEAGVKTAFVDLTRIGAQNVSPEQWYAGLMAETGRALGLRTEFLKYWKELLHLPPVQRYFTAIREVALEKRSAGVPPVTDSTRRDAGATLLAVSDPDLRDAGGALARLRSAGAGSNIRPLR